MKEIYHNECACLNADNVLSENCNKRYYEVLDVKNNEYKRIFICNEYLRLKINTATINVFGQEKEEVYNKIILDIIEYELNIKLNDWGFGNYRANDVINTVITVPILRAPYLYQEIKIKDALIMYLEGKTVLRDYLYESLYKYFSSNTLYVKYKTKYKLIFALIRKSKQAYGKEKEIIFTEIFTELLILNSKT